MTKEDNYNMSDFIQEEVAVRDYLLRKTHAAPDVSGELDSFLAKMTEDGKIREEISEVMSGDNLSDDMDLEKRSLVRRFAIPAILAMAASIALVLFLYFGKKHHHLDVPEGAVVAYEAEAENSQSSVTLQKGDEEPMTVASNQASCAKVNAIGATANATTAVRNILTTPANATAEVTLSDGTVVMVNAGSKLVYPQTFSGSTREVELQGEAYFNVRSYSSKDVHVTLLQGSVAVSTSSSTKRLKPGEDAVLYGGVLSVRAVDTMEYTAWKDGEFYFDNETLLNIAKEIGKWYQVIVIFQNPAKMHTRIFFAAPRDGGIEELLEVLNSLNKAKFTYHDGQVVIE